jgi:hypothetical protein
MDARARDESQSRQSSIKRPWDEGGTTSAEPGNSRPSALLPPVDLVSYQKSLIPHGFESGALSQISYRRPDSRESEVKRTKVEGHDYNASSRRDMDVDGKTAPSSTHSKSPTQSANR